MKEKPRWKMLSNSPKSHLFIDGKSLCGRWGYFGRDYDRNWTGSVKGKDCKACVKVAQRDYPVKEAIP